MEQALTYDELINEKHVQKGVKKGRLEGVQQVAENMIRKGFDETDIAEVSGLSLEEVSEIRRKLNGDGS